MKIEKKRLECQVKIWRKMERRIMNELLKDFWHGSKII